MWAQTLTDLAPAAVAIIVPIVVTWLTFRYALRREQRQWLREQRAQVYVDLLVETSAEGEWLEYTLARADMREEDRTPFPDHRMNDLERRRLGARVLAYGSEEVVRRHERLLGEGVWGLLRLRDELERKAARVKHELALNALRAQIRLELESEHGGPRWRRPKAARDALKNVPPPTFRGQPRRPPPPEEDSTRQMGQ
jgi:hypothetical protein